MLLRDVSLVLLLFVWRALCVTDEKRPMQLWTGPDAPSDFPGNRGTKGSNWYYSPTWHDEIEFPSNNLNYYGALDLAHEYYNWVITQRPYMWPPGSQETPVEASHLVAVFWDPRSQKTFASTIPRGPRRTSMAGFVKPPNNQCPLWYNAAQALFTSGTPPGRPPAIHAEDGAYFNFETSTDGTVINGLYPPGSFVAVWGQSMFDKTKNKADHEFPPCLTQLRQNSNGNWEGRTPTCQQVAQKLGVGVLGRLAQNPQPPAQVPDNDNEENYSDGIPWTQEEWYEFGEMAEAEPVTANPPRRRDATASGDDPATQTIWSAALHLPTSVNAGPMPSLSDSDFGVMVIPTTLSAAGATPTITPAPTGPSCKLQNAEPDAGINSPYCICDSSVTVAVQSISVDSPDKSCSFSALPGATAQVTPTIDLGPATTNTVRCEVCTPVENNEDTCSTILGCIVQTAGVTVKAGSSPVHVGTMTGTALYTAVSQALETLCPTVTQTNTLTYCSTNSQAIQNVPYVDTFLLQGELVVTVESSGYNATSLRDAMIQSAALTVQNAAAGNNCYTQPYKVEDLRKRNGIGFFGWLSSLYRREIPHPDSTSIEFCNTVGFAGVGYYGPFWHIDNVKTPTAWIYPHWEFSIGSGGDFLCDLLMDAVDLFAVVEPEFAIGDIELGEAVDLLCKDEMDD